MKHLANWIEIPVNDIDRGISFYNAILSGVTFYKTTLQDIQYGVFPTEDKFNCGALVKGEGYTPSANGIIVYLDGGPDLSIILDKVEIAGGKVLIPKTYLGEHAGYVGIFIDSEGNKIGLQHP